MDYVLRGMAEYTANILGHLAPVIKRVLEAASKLTIKYILTAHGVSWRDEALSAGLKMYVDFSTDMQVKKKVTIIYDSMYGTTGRVALAIAEGVKAEGALVHIIDMKASDLTKVALHSYDSAVVAFGSPTLNATYMPSLAAVLSYLKGLKLINKKPCAIFGAFGWAVGMKDLVDDITRAGGIVEDPKGLTWKF